MSATRSGWVSLQAQWQSNPRLRLGVVVILAVLWVYALLLAGDAIASLQRERERQQAQARELVSQGPPGQWSARAEAARGRLEALQAMRWSDAELGLVEAALQDWLRTTAAKAGARLREVVVARAVGGEADLGTSRQGSSAPTTLAPAQGQVIKARLSGEFSLLALIAFLAELEQQERAVVVEQISLRNWTEPPSVDMDVRIVGHAQAGTGAR